MDSKSIFQSALSLSPDERLLLIEALSKSLSEPDKDIDDLWKQEIEQRHKDYLDGKIKIISYDDIRKNDS